MLSACLRKALVATLLIITMLANRTLPFSFCFFIDREFCILLTKVSVFSSTKISWTDCSYTARQGGILFIIYFFLRDQFWDPYLVHNCKLATQHLAWMQHITSPQFSQRERWFVKNNQKVPPESTLATLQTLLIDRVQPDLPIMASVDSGAFDHPSFWDNWGKSEYRNPASSITDRTNQAP